MEGKQKIIIVSISLIMLALVGWAAWTMFNQKEPQPVEKTGGTNTPTTPNQEPDTSSNDTTITPGALPSDESITAAIVKQSPSLVDAKTNIPNFTITKTKEPLPGWYVATLHNTKVITNDAVVVMQNINNELVIVAGPGTGLTTDKKLPQEVREALY